MHQLLNQGVTLQRAAVVVKNTFRFYGSQISAPPNITDKSTKKFTETINLPKTTFPTRLNQKQREQVEKHINEVIPSS